MKLFDKDAPMTVNTTSCMLYNTKGVGVGTIQLIQPRHLFLLKCLHRPESEQTYKWTLEVSNLLLFL